MAGPSATGNFAQAGIATARENERLLRATLENSPDMGSIVQKAHIRQGKENIAAMRAEAKVSTAAINNYAATKTKQTKVDAEVNYTKEKRKAGILAGAGQLVAKGMLGLAEPKSQKREVGANNDYFTTQIEKLRAKADDYRTQADNVRMPDVPEFSTSSDTTTSQTSTDSQSNSGSGKTVSADISAQHAAGPGKLSKAQIKSYAVQAGFSPEEALTVVGIAGGESGFDPTNSTKRSGLYAKTGEDSVGLMQINWGYHKDSGWLQKLGITKREQLLDPATNMKAAKYLYDGRGNFGDWTVYNKGIYKDYL